MLLRPSNIKLVVLLVGGWFALRHWDWLLVVWRWCVAAGAGLVVAVVSVVCLLLAWLVMAELLGWRKMDDWPDSLMGGVAFAVATGMEVWATWRFHSESDGFFTSFLPRVAGWSAVTGLVPVALDRLFGSGRTREQAASENVGSSRSRKSVARKRGRYYLTPDGRMTRKAPPRAMADVVVDLDVKPSK